MWDIVIKIIFGVAVGWFVGYYTNKIAIWLLFNPKKPVMLGKLKVPCTPGLIIEKQNDLAERIGTTVEKEFVKPESIIKKTETEKFQAEVEKIIASSFQQFTSKDLKSLTEIIGEDNIDVINKIKCEIKNKMLSELSLYMELAETKENIHSVLKNKLAPYIEQPIKNWLNEKHVESIANFIADKGLNYLTTNDGQKTITEIIDKLAYNVLQDEKISLELSIILENSLPDFRKELICTIEEKLNDPKIENDIKQAITEYVIELAKGKLGALDVLMSLLPDDAHMETIIVKTINKKWPRIKSEINDGLYSDNFAKVLTAIGSNVINDMKNKTLLDIIGNDRVDLFTNILQEKIHNFVADENSINSIQIIIQNKISEICENPLSKVLPNINDLKDQLIERFIQIFTEDISDKKSSAYKTANHFLDELIVLFFDKMPLGRLDKYFPSEQHHSLILHVGKWVNDKISGSIPNLLDKLELGTLVADEIKILEPDKIENIVYETSRREMNAIVHIGGVAGAIVGGIFQPLLSYLI